MEILDVKLIGEFIIITTAFVQGLKNRPKLKDADGEVIAVAFGIVFGLVWYLVSGRIHGGDTWGALDWKETVRALTNGCVAGLTASGVFNIQAYLPIPNLLPTRTEKAVAPTQAQPDPQEEPQG